MSALQKPSPMLKTKLLKRVARKLFTKTRANTDTAARSLLNQTTTVSNALYRSIYELPLYAFIKCDIEGDLSALIISGTHSDEDLSLAWTDILSEFHEAIGETTTTMRLFLWKEILLLRINLIEIDLCLKALRSRYEFFFHNKLNLLLECSIEIGKDPSDKAYKKGLQRYKTRTVSITTMIKLKEAQLEAMDKNEADKPKATRGYYDNTLISLTDFAKVAVTDQITTYVYCERVRRLNAYIKSQKK